MGRMKVGGGKGGEDGISGRERNRKDNIIAKRES